MENFNQSYKEEIKCPICGKKIAEQRIGKTTKCVEILMFKGGKPIYQKVTLLPEYIENGRFKFPLVLPCRHCGKGEARIQFIGENLRGITFSYKGGCTEIVAGKKKIITERGSRKPYKIGLRFKKA